MNQIECNHNDVCRFFSEDENGNQSMMCGDCGTVVTLIHLCALHAVLTVETSDAIVTHVLGDPDKECVEDRSERTLETFLTF